MADDLDAERGSGEREPIVLSGGRRAWPPRGGVMDGIRVASIWFPTPPPIGLGPRLPVFRHTSLHPAALGASLI